MSEEADQVAVSDQLRGLYKNLDAVAADIIAKSGAVPSCGKGCAHCCSLLCTCTFVESLLIAETLIEKGELEELLPRLREAAKATDYPGVNTGSYFSKNIPCVFLKDGACSIYEIRPSACRFHFAISPPEQCSPEAKTGTTQLDLQRLEQSVWMASREVLNILFKGDESLLAGPLALMVLACSRIVLEGEPLWAKVAAACDGLRTPAHWMRDLLEVRAEKETP